MTENSRRPEYQTQSSGFKKVSTAEDWFEVYQVASDLFVFCEPRHYENTIVSLLIGQQKALLIDTGCGIGDLRRAVQEVTDKPVTVINTHTHSDHLGSNGQFDEIAMFDHALSRRVAEHGVSHETLMTELLAENLVTESWPRGFDRNSFAIPPFHVGHWLRDGERINVCDRDFEVIHTAGEAPDHICLLDRTDRILFCGDILLHGPVWTHLEGGSLKDLVASYRKLMRFFDDF
jgi:glyoxylase-like metal-dependent hydrolase (beta-lactamase superfamily II)